MEKNVTNNKILYIGLAILFVIFVVGIILSNNNKLAKNYNFPTPEKVVEQYFNSWNNKDYVNMYAAISDGFKKIEPTAKTFQDFKNYVDAQGIENLEIKEIKELSNDGQTASVNYNVEFIMNNSEKIPFKGIFTLKYRQVDLVKGWKLIHPYGENIDTS